MPPRHTYWTILFGGQPTSFRSATQDELLPTFRQIQSRHPDAVMMWFARGRLWKSEAEARDAFQRSRRPAWTPRPDQHGPGSLRPDRRAARAPSPNQRDVRTPRPNPRDARAPRSDRRDPAAPGPNERGQRAPRPDHRGRDWRPGGEHKDPRDRFKVPRDVKRARFKQKLRRDRTHPRPFKKKDEE
jgi:hypothetical protein